MGFCGRLIPVRVVRMKGIGTHVNTAHEEFESFAHEEYFWGL